MRNRYRPNSPYIRIPVFFQVLDHFSSIANNWFPVFDHTSRLSSSAIRESYYSLNLHRDKIMAGFTILSEKNPVPLYIPCPVRAGCKKLFFVPLSSEPYLYSKTCGISRPIIVIINIMKVVASLCNSNIGFGSPGIPFSPVPGCAR